MYGPVVEIGSLASAVIFLLIMVATLALVLEIASIMNPIKQSEF